MKAIMIHPITKTTLLSLLLLTVSLCSGFTMMMIPAPRTSMTVTSSSVRSSTSLAAQKMTPTRKTRREDSFDRANDDDDEEEEDNG
eukprot:scaffold12644_cov43-Cyclotella_meneghiniana.AAC.4